LKNKGIEVPSDFDQQLEERKQQKAIAAAPATAGPSSGGMT